MRPLGTSLCLMKTQLFVLMCALERVDVVPLGVRGCIFNQLMQVQSMACDSMCYFIGHVHALVGCATGIWIRDQGGHVICFVPVWPNARVVEMPFFSLDVINQVAYGPRSWIKFRAAGSANVGDWGMAVYHVLCTLCL
jgi:hypothetical protein